MGRNYKQTSYLSTTPKKMGEVDWDTYEDLIVWFSEMRIRLDKYLKLYFPTRQVAFIDPSLPEPTDENISLMKELKAKVTETVTLSKDARKKKKGIRRTNTDSQRPSGPLP